MCKDLKNYLLNGLDDRKLQGIFLCGLIQENAGKGARDEPSELTTDDQ